nr:transposase [Nocardia gipuzkoensis]
MTHHLPDPTHPKRVPLKAFHSLHTSKAQRFCNSLYDIEIRRVICSTNAIESLNARYRRAIKARGHFPTEQPALKCLYLVTRSLDPTGAGRARWTMRWKPAVNAFAITFADRWPNAQTY